MSFKFYLYNLWCNGQFRNSTLKLNNNRFLHKQWHVLLCLQLCGEKSKCNLLLRYTNGRVMDLCIEKACLFPRIKWKRNKICLNSELSSSSFQFHSFQIVQEKWFKTFDVNQIFINLELKNLKS